MSKFLRYQSIKRLGAPEVQGIEVGKVHVFPKLDGTNASCWWDPDEGICFGSRNRQLSMDNDNAGFHKDNSGSDVALFLSEFSQFIFYGEWLVPHTLKSYRDDAWRKFYIFDVWNKQLEDFTPYDVYKGLTHHPFFPESFSIIPPLAVITSPSEDSISKCVQENTYLLKDNTGVGEGVVIKRYGFRNNHGRAVWAKVVTNEFKESNAVKFGHKKISGQFLVEEDFASTYVTKSLVDKTLAKLQNEGVTDRSSLIPRLLQTVYHDVVEEDMWAAVKRYKNPTIDFKRLQAHVYEVTKQHAEDLF